MLGVNGGVVYLARHVSTGTVVALRVEPRAVGNHSYARFSRLCRLDHPILRVLEIDEVEGYYFYAIEYIERCLNGVRKVMFIGLRGRCCRRRPATVSQSKRHQWRRIAAEC
jgi:hypothetical protein